MGPKAQVTLRIARQRTICVHRASAEPDLASPRTARLSDNLPTKNLEYTAAAKIQDARLYMHTHRKGRLP